MAEKLRLMRVKRLLHHTITRTHTLLVNELVSCHTSLTEISRRHTVTVHTEKGTLSQFRQVGQGQQ